MTEDIEKRRLDIQKKFREKIDEYSSLMDEELKNLIEQFLWEEREKYYLSLALFIQLNNELFDMVRRLDILQELIDDDEITEIMINSSQHIFIEKNSQIFLWDKKFSSSEILEDVIQRIVAKVNRIVNETTPIVDARLDNGSRVNIVLPPVALDGATITIRKFKEGISLSQMSSQGMFGKELEGLLRKLVEAKYNLFISGGTGSGKTTFLNALSECISEQERVITIEDSAELQLHQVKNLVRLETRNANLSGKNAIGMDELIKTALRMRPDRIIVGEVRSKEVLSMFQAMNTGHDGSMSTGHANSPTDMISRLEAMAVMSGDMPLLAVRSQIVSAIDLLIHLERDRQGKRKVSEIMELYKKENGEISLNLIYQESRDFDEKQNCLEERILQKEKLQRYCFTPSI
ncbi:pilus assembly protein CpaF [Clostridia bacterium]|nr:pilus assembly protein CpaF [Clostridia bacterium]